MLCQSKASKSIPYLDWLYVVVLIIPKTSIYCDCFVQSQQPLEDLDAQLRRTLSPETVAVTSTVGVSFENGGKIFP